MDVFMVLAGCAVLVFAILAGVALVRAATRRKGGRWR